MSEERTSPPGTFRGEPALQGGPVDRLESAVEGAGSRPKVLGISGASGSGKSCLALAVARLHPASVALFDLDGYYREASEVRGLELGHDNPAAIDFDEVLRDVERLRAGEAVQIPLYNFERHRREGTRLCQPARVLVVEGIFAFADPRLRACLDLKVWVEAGEVCRLERRLERDTRERGRDVGEVLQRYRSEVVPGFCRFIAPLRGFADLIFENDGQDPERPRRFARVLMERLGVGAPELP